MLQFLSHSSFSRGSLAFLFALAAFAAHASDCAVVAPSYMAERTVTVGDTTFRTQVYASGDQEREEARFDGHARITIRTPSATTTFEPDLYRGVELSIPNAPRQQTRYVDSVGADGMHLRVTQFQRGQSWLDLSRTTCRDDGIMVGREFVAVDKQGREVKGQLTQSRIRLGPVPREMFSVPSNVSLLKQR
jgi:hypothetical protein